MPRLGSGRAATGLGALAGLLAGSLAVPAPAVALAAPSCDSVLDSPLLLREDKPVAVGIDCSGSVAGSELAVTVVEQPAHGTAGDPSWLPDVQHHAVLYDPDPGYVGPDSFTVAVSDGTATATYTADLELGPNSPPDCDDPDVHYGDAAVGGSYSWTIPCLDVDWQDTALDFSLAAGPAHGSVTLEHVADPGDNLSATYTADPGYIGTDTFTARVSDGDLDDEVEFHVYVSDPPWCFGDEPRQLPAGSTVRLQQVCNTPTDGTAWELRVVDPPGQGAVAIDGLHIDYRADPDGAGVDSFTYRLVTDSDAGNLVTQEIDIVPDAAPACDQRSATVAQGGETDVPLTCTDADGDAVTVTIDAPPVHGTLGPITDGRVTYTPDAGYAGVDGFTYTGSDGVRTSEPTSVSLAVTATAPPECTAPAAPVAVREARGGVVDLDCSWSGADLRDLDLTVVAGPGHGTTGSPYWDPDSGHHAVRYDADPGHTGPDAFTVRVSDGVTSRTTVVDLEVVPNRVPACRPGAPDVGRGGEVEVTLSCSDADGDELTLAIGDPPEHGSLGPITDGRVTYTPDAGFVGVDGFTYTAADYLETSAPSSVTVTVTDEDPPQLTAAGPTQAPRRVARHGLRLRLGSDEHVVGHVRLTVGRRAARRLGLRRHPAGPVGIGSADVDVAAGSRGVRVRLTRRARQAIRPVRRLTVRAVWVATDDAGNRSRVVTRVRLRR